MKILTLNYEYPPVGGGGGVIHQHLAEELAKRHDVSVITSGYKDLPPYEEVHRVKIHRVRVIGRNSLSTASLASMLSFHPACIAKGQELINKSRPDLINTHFAVPTGPSGTVLARRNRIAHALCIHGGDIFDPSKRLSPHRILGLRHTVRWVLQRAGCIVAQSKNTAANAKRIYGYADPIKVIPHGLPEPILPPFERSELKLPEDHIVLVTVGRLVARKSNHQLIEIISRLSQRKVTLVIVGDGPERTRLSDLAASLNLSDRVRLVGHVSEVQKLQLLQSADIFVSTTLHEGFGLMFLEGMFCGLPIISYDHGGQRDFLVDGKTGFLVSLNDQRKFQRDLERLIEEPSLRSRIGQFNRELAQKFTIECCAAQYEALFEELVHGKDAVMPSSPAVMAALSTDV